MNAVNKFERRIGEKRAARAGKGFTSFILNEDMNDITKIIKSLKVSGVIIDGVAETYVKGGVRRAGRGYIKMDKNT